MNTPDKGIPPGTAGKGELRCHHSGRGKGRLPIRSQLR
jgi:hypothetical protein